MQLSPNYYKDRVSLNVLANSVENAKECYDKAEGHVLLGVLSKNYDSNESAIADMKLYQKATNNALSVGLGQVILIKVQWLVIFHQNCSLNMLIKFLLE